MLHGSLLECKLTPSTASQHSPGGRGLKDVCVWELPEEQAVRKPASSRSVFSGQPETFIQLLEIRCSSEEIPLERSADQS